LVTCLTRRNTWVYGYQSAKDARTITQEESDCPHRSVANYQEPGRASDVHEGSCTKRLVELSRDDLERLFSFHLGGKERVWCADYRGEGVMFILWWDPDHTVYAVKKKNT